MELVCYYDKQCPNMYFKYIFNGIFEELKKAYPEHVFMHRQSPGPVIDCVIPGGNCSFLIYNVSNMKAINMSFWDRGMEFFIKDIGWEEYNIIQYIGGLRIHMSSQEIKETYGIDHVPYQYPLGMNDAYEYVDKYKTDYYPDKKIRKAVFMGALYGPRQRFVELTKNHPLIETDRCDTDDYFKKMANYRLAISFNGNGEICMRDFEAMGLKIPVVRPKLFTRFYNPIVPDFHYIKASEPQDDALYEFHIDYDVLTEQFLNTIESVIDDYDKLMMISKNGSEYFENYCRPDYMIKLFLKIAKINELQ